MAIKEGAKVWLWDHHIGNVVWDDQREIGLFEYAPDFITAKPFEPAPIHMPVQRGTFLFPQHTRNETWLGLPGMLADACPDKYGNQLIDQWLASQGRTRNSFSPVEQLLYMGERAMGALEFQPAIDKKVATSTTIHLDELVKIARQVVTRRKEFKTGDDTSGLEKLLQVGTSAGGARAKALIAWNQKTHEIRSGQVKAPKGFEHWLLKFDGVSDNNFDSSDNYGRVEYAYYLMANKLGIDIMKSELLEEGGRSHFVTKRFDRKHNKKIHLQTLCGLAHYNYCDAGGYSWEQVFQVTRKLNLGQPALNQLYTRMVFNIVFRNQDDHTKNISFLMQPNGDWSLSPAYDLTFAYKPTGQWTNRHQMTIAGKRDQFTLDDLIDAGKKADIKPSKSKDIINNVIEVAHQADGYLKKANVDKAHAKKVLSSLITKLD